MHVDDSATAASCHKSETLSWPRICRPAAPPPSFGPPYFVQLFMGQPHVKNILLENSPASYYSRRRELISLLPVSFASPPPTRAAGSIDGEAGCWANGNMVAVV